jgi:predicted pyridoxine 5'-phosphate oxidase superfamily flavin-nucleotide-binding protein
MLSHMPRRSSTSVAFSPSVKAVQRERGSRASYERVDARGFSAEVTADLAAFLAEVDTAFLATANADGQPYVQHRGGIRGFLHVLDDHTVGFWDHGGNRQYVTTGNLRDNPRVCLIAVDYAHRRRVKIWGTARAVAVDDPAAAALPVPIDGEPEQAILLDVTAWDVNCPQHIPMKVDAADVERAIARMQARIAELEAALAGARG